MTTTALAIALLLLTLAAWAATTFNRLACLRRQLRTTVADAVVVVATTAGITWRHDNSIGDLGSFTRAVGSRPDSRIASSSPAYGSASGNGTGGSSGGGGGR